MATCERCNNLLPRTVDQCPVCGLLIAVASEGRPEFEAPSAPGWANGGSAAPAGHDVDPFSQAPVWGTTAEQTPASDSGFSLDALSSSAKSTAPPINADSTVPQPGSPIAAEEPIAEYRPPASLGSSFGAAGYADHNTPTSAPAELGGLQQPSSQPVPEPGASPDPAAVEPTTVEPNLSYLVDPEPLTAALAPQRLGHDGSRPGSGVDPIASTPVEALSDDQSTRTVQAFSSRIEGDIKYGRSPRHNLITASLLALGMTAFGIGAGAGVIAASASDTLQSFEPEQLVLPEADIDLEAFHDAYGQNVVQLELLDCGVRKTVSGVASDATTVLVPWNRVSTDTTPIVRTSAGERIPARVIGSDARSGLAIVKLSQALEAGGFGWSGANQATSGTELILLHPNGRAGSSRAILSLGTERNNEGIPGAILVGDEPLEPYSFAVTETGRLIGAVSPSGSTLTTADVLRTVTGSFKANPDNPSSVCPPPPEPEEGEADADG